MASWLRLSTTERIRTAIEQREISAHEAILALVANGQTPATARATLRSWGIVVTNATPTPARKDS